MIMYKQDKYNNASNKQSDYDWSPFNCIEQSENKKI